MHTLPGVAGPTHFQLNSADAATAVLFLPSLLMIIAGLVTLLANFNPWSRSYPTVREQLEAEARAEADADTLDQPAFLRMEAR